MAWYGAKACIGAGNGDDSWSLLDVREGKWVPRLDVAMCGDIWGDMEQRKCNLSCLSGIREMQSNQTCADD